MGNALNKLGRSMRKPKIELYRDNFQGKQLCFIERGGKRVWSSAS